MSWLPLILFALFFCVAFVGRSLMLWRATGVNPYVLPGGDTAEAYVAGAFRCALLALLVVLALHGVGADAALGALPWQGAMASFWLGAAVIGIALVWVTLAQHQMGSSWRIGIDHERSTALVSRGVFALSRNPIFLGMRFALLGAVLMVPNAATLAIAVAGELLMQVQTRLEESHLRGLHGTAYASYAARVARWWGQSQA